MAGRPPRVVGRAAAGVASNEPLVLDFPALLPFIVVFALGTIVVGALADRVSRPRLVAAVARLVGGEVADRLGARRRRELGVRRAATQVVEMDEHPALALREKKATEAEAARIERDKHEAASYAIQLNKSRKEFETKLQIMKLRKGTLATQIKAAVAPAFLSASRATINCDDQIASGS